MVYTDNRRTQVRQTASPQKTRAAPRLSLPDDRQHELDQVRLPGDVLPRARFQNSLDVRLDVLDGSHIGWALGDTVNPEGWESSQITLITRLLPHIRQFVRVRQALVRAWAFETTATALLENQRIGIVYLDWRGEILAANDRASDILQRESGLSDRDGVLQAWAPEDQPRLKRLVAAALPTDGTVSVSGSMPLCHPDSLLPLVVHVKPVSVPQPDYGGRHVAVLVLLAEPESRWRIDPGLVAETLGLTPTAGGAGYGEGVKSTLIDNNSVINDIKSFKY